MADFQGGNSALQIGLEARIGQPPGTTAEWASMLFTTCDLGPDFQDIADPSLRPGAQESEGYIGKIPVEGSIAATMWPDLPLGRLLAEAQRKVTTTNPTTGVYLHRMGVSETTAAKSLSARLDRDDGAPETTANLAVRKIEIAVEPEKLPEVKLDLVAERMALWSLATAPTGTVTSAKFGSLRGLPSAALLALADGDVYFKVTDVTDAPDSIKGKVKIGSASAYDGAELTIPCGAGSDGKPQWTEITDENDAPIGTVDMPVELAISTGAGFSVNDVLKFTRYQPAWTTTPPSMAPLNEVYAEILIGGETYCLTKFTLSVTLPVEALSCIGGRFSGGLKRQGRREVKITIDRDYIDLRIYKRLISGERFTVVCTLKNGETVATGYDYFLKLTCPRVKAKGKAPQAAENLTESAELSCYQSPGDVSGYVDDLTIELQNGSASLTS